MTGPVLRFILYDIDYVSSVYVYVVSRSAKEAWNIMCWYAGTISCSDSISPINS
ncbi:hypothetical protein LXJ15735_29380 [Lacrimispora xylanolytica]